MNGCDFDDWDGEKPPDVEPMTWAGRANLWMWMVMFAISALGWLGVISLVIYFLLGQVFRHGAHG